MIVLLLYFGLNLPGLGGHGLWDPWEMDRAHVGRELTTPHRVLVIEARDAGVKMGPVASYLRGRYDDSITVVVPPRARAHGTETASRALAEATKVLGVTTTSSPGLMPMA